jgi:uroporphyrinogen III methyltransferase/synthase
VTSYEKILFTSPESVDEFFTAVSASGIDIRKIRADLYGASSKSIKALNNRGFVAAHAEEMDEPGAGALLIVGDESISKKEFDSADIMVTSKKELDQQFLPLFKRMLDEADINTMIFPSSASVELFIKALGVCDLNAVELLKGLQVISMGKQTEAAVVQAGLPSDGIPASATKEALVSFLAGRPVEEV